MCGRARCTLRPDNIARACNLNTLPTQNIQMDRYRPSYNVSPGANLPVVRRGGGTEGEEAIVHCMKWGLVPSFTKKSEKPDHYKMFNARSESVCEKASFRRLVPKNRCLVAVEGFYEWKKDGSKKQPYYIHLKDGRPLVFAALFDSWANSEGEILYTCTILTTSSSSALQWLHDRMPVILGDKESTDAWLNGSSSSQFNTVLKPYEDPDLVWYPVTQAMGKPSFEGPECIKEIQLKNEQRPISKFFSTKGIKNEQGLSNEPVKSNLPQSLKEEPAIENSTGLPSSTVKGDHDSACSRSVPQEESTWFTNLPKSLKQEPETEDKTGLPFPGDHDSKCDEEATKLPIKRDFEEFSADSKPNTDTVEKPSPVTKKGKLNKNAGDKQPTLFSYFGKS